MPDGPSVIDLSAARPQGDDGDEGAPEEPALFCPFSWMLGHQQNPISKAVSPMPFSNGCLKERCAIWNARDEQCSVLSMAMSTRSAFPGTQPAQEPAPASAE
jgi:hypothetical protein